MFMRERASACACTRLCVCEQGPRSWHAYVNTMTCVFVCALKCVGLMSYTRPLGGRSDCITRALKQPVIRKATNMSNSRYVNEHRSLATHHPPSQHPHTHQWMVGVQREREWGGKKKKHKDHWVCFSQVWVARLVPRRSQRLLWYGSPEKNLMWQPGLQAPTHNPPSLRLWSPTVYNL